MEIFSGDLFSMSETCTLCWFASTQEVPCFAHQPSGLLA
jgi:hypothetical protein